MKLSYLFAPFVAALLLGIPVSAPKLNAALPEPGCEGNQARHLYLLAYAYAQELPATARKFLLAADNELARCERDEQRGLQERIRQLRASLL